ncbi:ribonuclease HII/HIII [Spirochaeta thermophila DSM 6578]|uniref:Ribonuclease HII n=1 Tax=Winmispira thermophila (strain ATCC 700085 / DSM 6578 / Z-1203) TaxID=869211 RepID=G0GDK0_WINT7|nr:ribonuclease HII [Spirochaeta thermophila]AEJ61347.1 ribonuclease HII/HIII [Spirochaeta thermophila DSM 6578]
MDTVCGIDEVGRGPLAGPVVAAAVVLTPGTSLPGLKDSKKLSPEERERLFPLIQEAAAAVGVGWAWPHEVDRLNIHNATLKAMERAYEMLIQKLSPSLVPTEVVIDGRHAPPSITHARAVVKADTFVPEVMAASIVAKVFRDEWMKIYHRFLPEYTFSQHKGYPTRLHRERILTIGSCPIHRRTFLVRAARSP